MKKIILANWKQHGDLALLKLISVVCQPYQNTSVIGIFPPLVYLTSAHQLFSETELQLGAQNVSAQASGAFTGEVSASMLKEVGCTMALVGHSERRQLFGETDLMVAEKFLQVLKAGLMPVLCVGESLQEFEAGQTEAVIQRQLEAVIHRHNNKHFMVAYEPIWAIGTGKTATPDRVQQVHQFIRDQLAAQGVMQRIPILYGGSVKPENAHELLAAPGIDGVLVGGSSLVPEQFEAILKAT